MERLQWFPMRVTYNRELKIKAYFDELDIETFIPMRYDLSYVNGVEKELLVPAIHNLIFVHSTQETLTTLKQFNSKFAPLRYIMSLSTESKREPIIVPSLMMENFMKATAIPDKSLLWLDKTSYIDKIGKKVRITAGKFKDVCGVVKRIKRNKCIVVQIEGLAAVAITFVPVGFIEEIATE